MIIIPTARGFLGAKTQYLSFIISGAFRDTDVIFVPCTVGSNGYAEWVSGGNGASFYNSNAGAVFGLSVTRGMTGLYLINYTPPSGSTVTTRFRVSNGGAILATYTTVFPNI